MALEDDFHGGKASIFEELMGASVKRPGIEPQRWGLPCLWRPGFDLPHQFRPYAAVMGVRRDNNLVDKDRICFFLE